MSGGSCYERWGDGQRRVNNRCSGWSNRIAIRPKFEEIAQYLRDTLTLCILPTVYSRLSEVTM